MTNASVLIVGAGPTGLALALSLMKQGLRPRIIDQNSGPGLASRAMVVHARILEFYQQFGIADEIVAQGVPVEYVRIFDKGNEVAELKFKDIATGTSPFPFALAYAQDEHEKFLTKKLETLGLQVEWNTKLKNFTHFENGVDAVVVKNEKEELSHFEYLCGCDGAHSIVRETLKLGFPGGTYSQIFFVADVKVEGEFNKDLRINLDSTYFGLQMPVRTTGMQRLIGIVPPEFANKKDLKFDDFRDAYEKLLRIKVQEVNWFSTYHTHHRVTEKFQVGRCFLLGDAGHIHSPAGGQGMNTGIGDAVNLGWKLAHVLQGRANSRIIHTYNEERLAFAKTLVKTTDSAFRVIVGKGLWGKFARVAFAPAMLKVLWSFQSIRRAVFRVISQININYRSSDLSVGATVQLHGGDRLPWLEKAQNFECLKSLNWQMHVFGDTTREFAHACDDLKLETHKFAWDEAAKKMGFLDKGAYLIRPDGYIAVVIPDQNAETLRVYAKGFNLVYVSQSSP